MFKYSDSPNEMVRIYHAPDSKKFNANFRPVYGGLQIFEDSNTVGAAPNYGNAAFYFSAETKKYMTLTGSDSLNLDASFADVAVFDNLYPLISKMSRDSFGNVQAVAEGRLGDASTLSYSNYIEVQLHSKTRWSNMEGVVFQSREKVDEHLRNKAILSFLKKNAIATSYKK